MVRRRRGCMATGRGLMSCSRGGRIGAMASGVGACLRRRLVARLGGRLLGRLIGRHFCGCFAV